MNNTVIVDGDLEVRLTSIYQGYSTNLIEGLPFKRVNDNAIAQALDEAKRWSNCPVIHLIEPIITPIPWKGNYPFGTPERLPHIKCIANLHYFTAIRDKSKDGADITVVWFQDEFAFPIQEDILEKFKKIPFREICWEYEY